MRPHPTLLALSLLALTLAACDRHDETPPPPVRPVMSLVVTARAPEIARHFSGIVEARYQSDLGFQIGGRMVARSVNVGESVRRGQELARLDPAVERLAVSSARADLVNAEAQLTNALATFRRQQQLFASGSATRAQLETATASRDTAQARVDQQQANLQKALQEFDHTRLVDDYDGVVAAWTAEVGQVVAAAQTVVTIARPDLRDAVFDVPDSLVERFAAGSTHTVRLLVDESLTAEGVVREIGPLSDPATRTRRIRLTLTAPPDAFRLGTTVSIALAEPRAAGIEVPDSAILDRDGRPSVWLVGADGVVKNRPVTLASRTGALATVAQGLAPGDRIVTCGVHELREGQVVRP